ncbi:MAG: hypothetical protein R2828_20820 [Saprospiraceae bacterium]
MKFPLFLSFTLFLLLFFSNCRPSEEVHLGTISFTASGAPAAQTHFEKGLLLLHSFEYDDAREAFQAAIAADTNMVMAYWGVAMSHNHGLWRQQAYEKGQAILAKLAPQKEARLAKAETPLEKDFLQAIEIMYGEGTKLERDQAYAKYMEGLVKKYPDNHEVRAFYALSLLGAVPVGRDDEAYEKGARIAQGILNENPQHPGALHYLIHSYDDPYHANLALQAANNYAKVAPDASHALHMPSHIYVAMGMWDEVISSNIASFQASLNRMEKKELDNDAQSYHALAWLLYGYLQKEQFEKADEIMADMEAYTQVLPSTRARSYLVEMKANYLVETGNWEHEFADIPVKVEDLNITDQATAQFIKGMKAYLQKDTASLRQAILTIAQSRQENSLLVSETGVPLCSAVSANQKAPNQLDLDQANIMEMELRALYYWHTGQTEAAEEWLRRATALEEEASYVFGPPVIAKPSFELYGDWLLAHNRPADALLQFEKALERGPNRTYALKGKRLAQEQLKNNRLSLR